ncbi:GIY-YIG nuclease family protein [Paraburkholderia sp. BR13444]|uniref:GIY-YIG nuclease family protein n=1 Tax=Paraburkholderia sp. BR13444 TaxID=3236997 RepID=UPI0034CF13D7
MLRASVLELSRPEGAVLFDLTAFPAGPSAVIDRISDGQSGIYAWFRSFRFRESPEEFAEDLLSAIRAPKFQSRKGDVAPYYEVELRSKGNISKGKESELVKALKDDKFLAAMKFSLDWSMLFQMPLYVGKSINLKARIGQHLSGGSILRNRLKEAGLDIEQTYLLLVPTPPIAEFSENVSDDETDELDMLSPYEGLFEEVFSRLFNPGFTIRLG